MKWIVEQNTHSVRSFLNTPFTMWLFSLLFINYLRFSLFIQIKMKRVHVKFIGDYLHISMPLIGLQSVLGEREMKAISQALHAANFNVFCSSILTNAFHLFPSDWIRLSQSAHSYPHPSPNQTTPHPTLPPFLCPPPQSVKPTEQGCALNESLKSRKC